MESNELKEVRNEPRFKAEETNRSFGWSAFVFVGSCIPFARVMYEDVLSYVMEDGSTAPDSRAIPVNLS
jgi:hypothetical protein